MKEVVMGIDLNRVMLIGRLTADPESRVVKTGNTVTSFTIAVNRKWKSPGSTELHEEATFVDVDSWGKSAEAIKKYFSKGRTIFIEGRLRLDRWETKSGEKRSRMKVVVDRFSFVPDGKFTGKTEAIDGGDDGEALPVPVSAPVVVDPVAVGAGVGGGDHVMRTPRLVPDPLDGPADRFDAQTHDDEMPF
jgi:single-strand DNA-binding protein